MRTTSSKESWGRVQIVSDKWISGARERRKENGGETELSLEAVGKGRTYAAIIAPRTEVTLRRGVRLVRGAVRGDAVGHFGTNATEVNDSIGDRTAVKGMRVGPDAQRGDNVHGEMREIGKEKKEARVREAQSQKMPGPESDREAGTEYRRAGRQKKVRLCPALTRRRPDRILDLTLAPFGVRKEHAIWNFNFSILLRHG